MEQEKKQSGEAGMELVWEQARRWRPGRTLMKNLAVSAALVISAVTLRCGALPGAEQAVDAVLTAAGEDTLLDDRLGKLSFVGSFFPEAALVFGSNDDYAWPVEEGTAVHAWNEAEPYMAWQTTDGSVFSAADGVVMETGCGADGLRTLTVRNEDGLLCVYGGLKTIEREEGDSVARGEHLGTVGEQLLCMEVFRSGRSIDPAEVLGSVR